jgi:hypothetical protein
MTMRNTGQAGKRQRRHAKSGESQSVLSRLTGQESSLVLHMLLKRHEPLREEAETLATEIVSTPSCEDIASAVVDAVTSLDIEDLGGRAGATRWGYTEPTEAAWQLLEESMEDCLADMKRRAELGLTDAAVPCAAASSSGCTKPRARPPMGRWAGRLTSPPRKPAMPWLNSCERLPSRRRMRSVCAFWRPLRPTCRLGLRCLRAQQARATEFAPPAGRRRSPALRVLRTGRRHRDGSNSAIPASASCAGDHVQEPLCRQ